VRGPVWLAQGRLSRGFNWGGGSFTGGLARRRLSMLVSAGGSGGGACVPRSLFVAPSYPLLCKFQRNRTIRGRVIVI